MSTVKTCAGRNGRKNLCVFRPTRGEFYDEENLRVGRPLILRVWSGRRPFNAFPAKSTREKCIITRPRHEDLHFYDLQQQSYRIINIRAMMRWARGSRRCRTGCARARVPFSRRFCSETRAPFSSRPPRATLYTAKNKITNWQAIKNPSPLLRASSRHRRNNDLPSSNTLTGLDECSSPLVRLYMCMKIIIIINEKNAVFADECTRNRYDNYYIRIAVHSLNAIGST